jgi:hypothetical protein
MKHFDVYLHPMLGIEAVKTGFSWRRVTVNPKLKCPL